jgi:hypothetical protein
MGQSIDKATMKALRESRKAAIARARKSIKENNQILKAIRDQIAGEPKPFRRSPGRWGWTPPRSCSSSQR